MSDFEPIRLLVSRTIVVPQDNVDTDQIIPARFLTTTSREGLGPNAFFDWRYDADGRVRNNSPFNGFDPAETAILVAGANFGCGSSREHAPWALLGMGLRAVISSDIADIFKSNALKNGLLPIEADAATHAYLLARPGARVAIDLETLRIDIGDGPAAAFAIEPFARACLLDGVDQFGALLKCLPEIEAFERREGAQQ